MNEISKEKYIKIGLYVAAGISLLILPIIVLWVGINGIGAISWDFLTQSTYKLDQGGIFPQIVGSLYLVALCTLFSAPLGIASAIYLSEYAPDNIITQTVRFFTETLASLPSVVLGLFGLEVLVWEFHLGYSLLSGGIALTFLSLPWIIRASEEAIKVVPKEYKEASLALGASKWQTIIRVVIPASLPGIITGVLLGMGKAIGETVVVWMTAGSGLEAFLPRTIQSPTSSLPVYIYILAKESRTASGLQHAYGASLVLILMFMAISVTALLLRNHFLKKLSGR